MASFKNERPGCVSTTSCTRGTKSSGAKELLFPRVRMYTNRDAKSWHCDVILEHTGIEWAYAYWIDDRWTTKKFCNENARYINGSFRLYVKCVTNMNTKELQVITIFYGQNWLFSIRIKNTAYFFLMYMILIVTHSLQKSMNLCPSTEACRLCCVARNNGIFQYSGHSHAATMCLKLSRGTWRQAYIVNIWSK